MCFLKLTCRSTCAQSIINIMYTTIHTNTYYPAPSNSSGVAYLSLTELLDKSQTSDCTNGNTPAEGSACGRKVTIHVNIVI